MVLTLLYEKRDAKQKPNTLRRAGKIPAVFYGKRIASTPIALSVREFEKIWKKAGENTVVTLAGTLGEIETLICDTDRHPVTGVFRHVDFHVFEKGQKLRVKVPIEFTGVAPAVKDLGGVLVKVLHDVEIEASPKDLPRSISVDISPLVAFDSVILAKNILLPPGVTLIASPEAVAASVYEPKEEKMEEAAPTPDLSQIEVVKKGKEAAPEGAVGKNAEAAAGAKESKVAEKGTKGGAAKAAEKKI